MLSESYSFRVTDAQAARINKFIAASGLSTAAAIRTLVFAGLAQVEVNSNGDGEVDTDPDLGDFDFVLDFDDIDSRLSEVEEAVQSFEKRRERVASHEERIGRLEELMAEMREGQVVRESQTGELPGVDLGVRRHGAGDAGGEE